MKTIFLMIIFFAPGLVMKAAYKYYNKKAQSEETNPYDYIFEIATHGTIVFILTQVLWRVSSYVPCLKFARVTNLSEILNKMDSLTFDFAYLALTLLCTWAWYKVFHQWVIKALEENKKNKAVEKFGVKTESNTTVYEKVFRDPANKDRLVPIEIIKDGKRVTCGILDKRNSPNYKHMEFTLEHTKAIEEILKDDEQRSEAEKILGKIRFEYYVPEYDMLIRFFKRKKLEDYWKTITNNNSNNNGGEV